MSNEVKLNVSQSRGYENVDIKTISSREVAVMMDMTSKDGHSDLMKKIGKINETLLSEKIPTANYWFESTYKDSTGRTLKEYQVTKKGCEMLAHKSTGNKGIIFTHKYMERFEQMEQALHNPYANLSPELQLLIKLEQGQTELDQRIGDLENNMTIDYSQQETLRLAISTRVYQLLGNAKENAKLRSKVYSNLHRCIKKQFSVNSYKNIAVKEFEKARSMITTWMPDEIMMLAIQGAKSQMSLM